MSGGSDARAGSDEVLEAAFGAAQPDHFAWQTEGAFIADEERALVRAAFMPLQGRVLDLGCGEGATLLHLGEPAGAVGVDLFPAKVAFAQARLPKCRFIAASALDLPFEAGSFDHVLVRDVVHHIPEPEALIDECRRVLVRGGRIDVLEPCRYNPLIAAHAIALPVERGELRSTRSFLRELVARRFDVVRVAHHQPMPIHRIVFHPDMGSPKLAEQAWARAAVGGFERLAGRILPKTFWAYLHVRAVAR